MGKKTIEINKIDAAGKQSMRNRTLTAIVLILVCGTGLFLGGWFWTGFVILFLSFSIYEFLHVTQKKYRWYIYAVCIFSSLLFCLWPFLKANFDAYEAFKLTALPGDKFIPSPDKYCREISISTFAAIVSLFSLLICSILHENFDLHDVAYLFMMCFLVGFGFQTLLVIRYYPVATLYKSDPLNVSKLNSIGFKYFESTLLIAFCIFSTYINDACAYFVGVFFGKHKINPRISPKKTFEGFYGGWLLSTLLSFGVGCAFCAGGFPLIAGILDLEHWYWILLLCFFIPLLGNLGDFSFSLIKRKFNMKDYGWIVIGHGGVLDRADSLLFSCIGVALLLSLISTGWSFF